MDKKPIPELNKTYYCYDDGKPYLSRQYEVKVVGIIPFDEASEFYKDLWRMATEQCDWLFDKTDYIIETISYELDYPEVEIMGRTNDGGWFGLGRPEEDGFLNTYLYSGRLDIDNSITKNLHKSYDK